MKTFETASFHIVKPCNMKCKFCYATFDDFEKVPQMSFTDAVFVLGKLRDAGVEKITFAGGEPLMYKYIKEVIMAAKAFGLTTSIITNGSLIDEEWLDEMKPFLDWIGISIDSINWETNNKIGRNFRGTPITKASYITLISAIKTRGYKFKLNTVVNAYNWQEDMNKFINFVEPERWKVFQALRVEGQNDEQFDEVKVTDEQFNHFLNTHANQKTLVPESNEAMTGSYLLIDPRGRLFENSKGRHTYSDSLIDNDFEHCQNQLEFNRDMFIQRGGIYNW